MWHSCSEKLEPETPNFSSCTTSCDAATHARNVRHPVSTILPDVKSSTVHAGSAMRIVIAANFCLSYTLFGSSFEIENRSSGPTEQFIFAVPTRLWICASGHAPNSGSGGGGAYSRQMSSTIVSWTHIF